MVSKRDHAREVIRLKPECAGSQTHIVACARLSPGRHRDHLVLPHRRLREHTTQVNARVAPSSGVTPAHTLLVHKLLDMMGIRARLGSSLTCRWRFRPPFCSAGVIVECIRLRPTLGSVERGIGRIHRVRFGHRHACPVHGAALWAVTKPPPQSNFCPSLVRLSTTSSSARPVRTIV